MRCPLIVQPSPLPATPPPAAAAISGVMMLSVKALINVEKPSATTSPTAMMTRSPCIRKFLKPFIPTPLLLDGPSASWWDLPTPAALCLAALESRAHLRQAMLLRRNRLADPRFQSRIEDKCLVECGG